MKVVCITPFLAEISEYLLDEASVVLAPRALETEIRLMKPDVVLSSFSDPNEFHRFKADLIPPEGAPFQAFNHAPIRLDEIYEMFEAVGRQLKVPEKGHALSGRVKAQTMDWCASFYDRIKNKRVTFIASIEPLMLGGRWIPDMIRAASGHPQGQLAQSEDQLVRWEEVVEFNPDVMIVAPKNLTFPETLKSFKALEKLPHWDEIYAVKRGDVFFTDGGTYFNTPTQKLIESMGILISAMAGFESGYITPRDSMFKLRFLELHRHKYL